MSDNIAIYPGSFDPITNGHLDLIERGRHLFDHLVVALLTNLEKQPLFSVDERLEMLRLVTKGMPNVSLDTFSGLLVDYARGGKPIGVEITTPASLSVAAFNRVLRGLGFAPVKREDVAPLIAA